MAFKNKLMNNFFTKIPKDVKEKAEEGEIGKSSTSISELPELVEVPTVSENITNKVAIGSNSSQSLQLERSTSTGGNRKFRESWKDVFKWIDYRIDIDKVFCLYCTKARNQNAFVRMTATEEQNSLKTYTELGFTNWKKAIERFQTHERSKIHRAAIGVLTVSEMNVNVGAQIHTGKMEEMKRARIALLKIFSTVRYLCQQGIAIRGHEDADSNIIELLNERAEETPELKSWLSRSTSKWLSHDVLNEYIELLAKSVLKKILTRFRKKYYGIMLDESQDVSIKEQMTVCFRYVDENFEINEDFVGLYEVPSTDADTLFNVVKDILVRFELPISNCRGMCFDGANNMSGVNSGLQKKIKGLENAALFIHCFAHVLNLLLKDAIEKVLVMRNFINMIKDLLTFLRASPKRFLKFKNIESSSGPTTSSNGKPNLRPYCPTRWTVRVKSLKSVLSNYNEILMTLSQISVEETNESGAKAAGLYKYLMKFDNFFLLRAAILLFERIETISVALQKKTMVFSEAVKLIENGRETIMALRDEENFEMIFNEVTSDAEKLKIEEPKLPRKRNLSMRKDSRPETASAFISPKKYYRKIFFEILDQAEMGYRERFELNNADLKYCMYAEKFILKKYDEDNDMGDEEGSTSSEESVGDKKEHLSQEEEIEAELQKLYGKDFTDFSRLKLHRDMLLDFFKRDFENGEIEKVPNSFHEVYIYLKDRPEKRSLLPEITNFVEIILCVGMSTATAERSFSCLRRLKTYLRSTTGQARLNHITILNTHKDLTKKVNLNKLCNEFISKSASRRNVFALQ